MVYLILVGYILLTFASSLIGNKKVNQTPEGYFLAGRNVGTLTLFFTILATNFSAFYFLGFAGEGYRVGYAYYVIMALGTGFACLSFFILGTRIWEIGKQEGLITPGEFILHKSGSQRLQRLYTVIMLVFTFPYLALQIIGGGYLLEQITAGSIPYFMGATILTIFTICYVLIGGMNSVAKTDLKQGLLAIVMMFLAVAWISNSLGGISVAHDKLMELTPSLFSREGVNNVYTPQKWFSWLIFWIFAIPMFPQIFMRFYIAKDLSRLKKSAILYGAIPLIISLFPVIIGVLGHLSFPGLEGRASDQILPKMLLEHTPLWFGALVMTGALAAFMSTLDSQLLALSTMLTRDLVLPFSKKDISLKQQVNYGKIGIVILAFVGLAIAHQPFSTLFDMGKLAFSGLSILFPTTFALLYFRRLPIPYYICSILFGELVLLGFYYKLIDAQWLFGFESFIIALFVSMLVLIAGALMNTQQLLKR